MYFAFADFGRAGAAELRSSLDKRDLGEETHIPLSPETENGNGLSAFHHDHSYFVRPTPEPEYGKHMNVLPYRDHIYFAFKSVFF